MDNVDEKAQIVEDSGELLEFRKRVEALEKELAEYKRAAMECFDCEARYRMVFDHATDGMHVMELDTRKTIDANKKFSEMTGYSPEELKSTDFSKLFPAEALPDTLEEFERLSCQEQTMAKNVIVRRKDGTFFSADIAASPVVLESANCLVSIYRDITERNRLEGELKRLATTDSLTQAYNRMKFDEIIGDEMERAERFSHPLSIIIFDLDYFKAVNDNHGHVVGDDVLRAVANIVKGYMRKVNHLIRWGGEEFMIVAIETPIEKAAIFAEKVRSAVERHDFDHVGTVTISLGVTELSDDDGVDDLIKRGDDALYLAKRRGRNRVEVLK